MPLTATGTQVAWHDPGAGDEEKCCCGVFECCMYPWPDPEGIAGGPFYPAADLPDTIILVFDGADVVMTRSGFVYYGESAGIGFIITPSTGSDSWGVGTFLPAEPEDITYLHYVPCLFVTLFSAITEIREDYPETLTLTDASIPATCDLNRVDLCCWEGTLEYVNEFEEPVSVPVRLCYHATDPAQEIFPDGWPGKPCWLLRYGDAGLYMKEDPQNGPVGTYGFGGLTVAE